MVERIVAGLSLMVITILIIFVMVIGAAIAVFIILTLWALIRPHISNIVDKWWNWFYKRVD